MISSTYAGKCGEPGFVDGPRLLARFNKPDSLGVDVYGNLYVYDEGNTYIRQIQTNQFTWTMLKGSCRDAHANYSYELDKLTVLNPKHKKVLCYKNWRKIFGQPTEHIDDLY